VTALELYGHGTPDSPMNYSGARLIFPTVAALDLYRHGAPDTVRWHTEHSGALVHSTLKSLLRFKLVPNLNLLLACVEPYALYFPFNS
jgi:hypothetical protein